MILCCLLYWTGYVSIQGFALSEIESRLKTWRDYVFKAGWALMIILQLDDGDAPSLLLYHDLPFNDYYNMARELIDEDDEPLAKKTFHALKGEKEEWEAQEMGTLREFVKEKDFNEIWPDLPRLKAEYGFDEGYVIFMFSSSILYFTMYFSIYLEMNPLNDWEKSQLIKKLRKREEKRQRKIKREERSRSASQRDDDESDEDDEDKKKLKKEIKDKENKDDEKEKEKKDVVDLDEDEVDNNDNEGDEDEDEDDEEDQDGD